MCSLVMSAYFLSKMVNRASIKGKQVQFHNNLTFYCGFNKEMNRLKEIHEEAFFPIPFLILSLILSLIS